MQIVCVSREPSTMRAGGGFSRNRYIVSLQHTFYPYSLVMSLAVPSLKKECVENMAKPAGRTRAHQLIQILYPIPVHIHL